MLIKFFSWIFSKLRDFFGLKAGKITAAAVGAVGAGAAGYGAVQAGKAIVCYLRAKSVIFRLVIVP